MSCESSASSADSSRSTPLSTPPSMSPPRQCDTPLSESNPNESIISQGLLRLKYLQKARRIAARRHTPSSSSDSLRLDPLFSLMSVNDSSHSGPTPSSSSTTGSSPTSALNQTPHPVLPPMPNLMEPGGVIKRTGSPWRQVAPLELWASGQKTRATKYQSHVYRKVKEDITWHPSMAFCESIGYRIYRTGKQVSGWFSNQRYASAAASVIMADGTVSKKNLPPPPHRTIVGPGSSNKTFILLKEVADKLEASHQSVEDYLEEQVQKYTKEAFEMYCEVVGMYNEDEALRMQKKGLRNQKKGRFPAFIEPPPTSKLVVDGIMYADL